MLHRKFIDVMPIDIFNETFLKPAFTAATRLSLCFIILSCNRIDLTTYVERDGTGSSLTCSQTLKVSSFRALGLSLVKFCLRS